MDLEGEEEEAPAVPGPQRPFAAPPAGLEWGASWSGEECLASDQ